MRSVLLVMLLAATAAAEPTKFCGKEIDASTTKIECEDKQVSDLSPLAVATSLEELDVIGLPVSDLTPLAGLTKLRELKLRMTKVTKLDALAKLTSLQELNLMYTGVSDLKPLAALPLRKLLLAGTKVSNIAPLAGVLTLDNLDLSDTKVTTVKKALAKHEQLGQVDLRQTKVPKAEAQWLGKRAGHVYWGANGEGHYGTATGKH